MTEPVSLDLAKQHLDVTRDDQDVLIEVYIGAAKGIVEGRTGHLLTRREVVDQFDYFNGSIPLSAWPIVTDADVAVTYVDGDDEDQSVAGVRLSTAFRPARVRPSFGGSWPSNATGPIAVTYSAGYESDQVPPPLVAAMLLIIGDLYQNRETQALGITAQLLPTLDSLIDDFRLKGLG